MNTYELYKTRGQAENAAKAKAIKCNGYIERTSIDATSSDFEQMFYHPEITGEFPCIMVEADNGDEHFFAWINEDEEEYRSAVEGAVIDYVANTYTSDDVMNAAGIQGDEVAAKDALYAYSHWCLEEWECNPDGATPEQAAEDAEHLKECVDTLISLANDLASDDEVINDTIEHIEWLSYIKRQCQEAAKRADKNNSGEDVDYTATDAQKIEGEDAWLVTFSSEEQGITSAAIVWREERYGEDNKKHHVVYFIDDWQGSYPTCKEEIPDYDWVDENWHRCVVAADDPMPRMLFTY
jgi:hypothetical protein